MEKLDDKTLENFTKNVMKHVPLESPSADFTSQIMARVKALENSQTVYRPLISKSWWVLIAVVIISFSVYLWSIDQPSNLEIFKAFNFSFLSKNALSQLVPNVAFSQPTVYALLLFSIMIWIQIPLLKRYFNHRSQV